uniref:Uncharacterized protein n=1 Tax=viral metagenome TaxID=1070528 RepID=A0A6C0KES4_9ZZZZ
MDRGFLVALAEKEIKNRRYGQLQADLRNVANESAFGQHTAEFFTTDNVCSVPNSLFWRDFLAKINDVAFADQSLFDRLSIYEYTNVVASRALNLSMGVAHPDSSKLNGVARAVAELQGGTCQALLRRRAANGDLIYLRANDVCPKRATKLKHFGDHFVRSHLDTVRFSNATSTAAFIQPP